MLTLRRATPADIPVLTHWDDQPHVRASGVEDDWDWAEMLAEDPPWRAMLMAEAGGRPIGFVMIIDPEAEETRYWGDCGPGLRAIDIWIGAAEDLRRGFGRQMMREALARCFADPAVGAVLIDPLASNTGAHRFYEAMGFSPVGPRRFGTDDCLVYRLTRARWREGV